MIAQTQLANQTHVQQVQALAHSEGNFYGCYVKDGKLKAGYTVSELKRWTMPTAYYPFATTYNDKLFYLWSNTLCYSHMINLGESWMTNSTVQNVTCYAEVRTPEGAFLYALDGDKMHAINMQTNICTSVRLNKRYTAFCHYCGRIFLVDEEGQTLDWTGLDTLSQGSGLDNGGSVTLNNISGDRILSVLPSRQGVWVIREQGYSLLKGGAEAEAFSLTHAPDVFPISPQMVAVWQDKLVFVSQNKVYIGDSTGAKPCSMPTFVNFTKLIVWGNDCLFLAKKDENSGIYLYCLNLLDGSFHQVDTPFIPTDLIAWTTPLVIRSDRYAKLCTSRVFRWMGRLYSPDGQRGVLRQMRMLHGKTANIMVYGKEYSSVNAVSLMRVGRAVPMEITSDQDFYDAVALWEVTS